MEPLLLDIINASAPYEVYWHEKSRTYRFKSDFGVVLAIGFDDDDIIENAESLIIRKDHPNILDIVAEFSNTVAMFRVKPNSQD